MPGVRAGGAWGQRPGAWSLEVGHLSRDVGALCLLAPLLHTNVSGTLERPFHL